MIDAQFDDCGTRVCALCLTAGAAAVVCVSGTVITVCGRCLPVLLAA